MAAAVLPLGPLLHPSVIAITSRSIPTVGNLVMAATMRLCREAARRINLAQAVYVECTTGMVNYSPADRKTELDHSYIVDGVKKFCKMTDQAIEDPERLEKVLKIRGLGGLAISSKSSDEEIKAAVAAADKAFELPAELTAKSW